jgi:hypothetical protein
MRPNSALLALALVGSHGLEGLADDGPRPTLATTPASAPATTSKGLFGRFRKPAVPEVPPNKPRQSTPRTSLSTPPDAPKATLPAPRPAVAAHDPLRPISTVPRPSPVLANDTDRGQGKGKEADTTVHRTQATAADLGLPIGPGSDSTSTSTVPGGSSLSLQQALYGALTSNPDLVALRTGNPALASAEAVEVARHFPVALNPTVFIDYRPITLIPNGTFGNSGAGGSTTGSTAAASNHGF